MQPTDLTIDQVVDNGDNSLSITGHDTSNTSYTTSMGRKSDLPTDPTQQMAYYQQVLADSIPPSPAVLYQAQDYTPAEQ
jgi:hypothetical protein